MPDALVTGKDIVRGLRNMGLVPGAIVEVHGSLSAFGTVEGGADTVIAALQELVTMQGTLIMPAYPVSLPVSLSSEDRDRGVIWKVRKLAVTSRERTGMGSIADAFRAHPNVVCGHTFHRNCAWGANRERYCNDLVNLMEDGANCLLLGVGIDRCSSMHVAERVPLPEDIESCWHIPDEVRLAYDEEQWAIGYGGTPEDAWQNAWQKADHSGLLRHGKVGNATSHYFRVRAVVEMYEQWRKTDPYGLFGVSTGEGRRTSG